MSTDTRVACHIFFKLSGAAAVARLAALRVNTPVAFQCADTASPCVQPGEMNLRSMNGEGRLRLTQKFTDPPGQALPDCLIAAGIAQRTRAFYPAASNSEMAARFAGFDWASLKRVASGAAYRCTLSMKGREFGAV